MPALPSIVFDVNETLLDLQTMERRPGYRRTWETISTLSPIR